MNGVILNDITIIDLSVQLPGPYATMLLRSLGARVIKVEPPGGDFARIVDPPMFETLNAGKESIELDLGQAEARELLHRLTARADVVVEGFRPGVADRLGAGYAELSALQPDLVYCSLSGYGQTGPYRSLPGHDLNYLGVGGGAEGPEDGSSTRPEQIGVPVVDLASGTAAALSIVAALRDRDRTGCGRYLDVAMIDSAVVWSNLKWQPASLAGEPSYGIFSAHDGLQLSLAIIEDKFWRNLCDLLGWDEWRDTDEFATHAARKLRADEIVARLADTLVSRSRKEWLAAFAAADVPAAPVHESSAVRSDPQVAARELFIDSSARLRAPLPPDLITLPVAPAPLCGEHMHLIVQELGAEPPARPAAVSGKPSTEGVV